jgi:hypothetical protein
MEPYNMNKNNLAITVGLTTFVSLLASPFALSADQGAFSIGDFKGEVEVDLEITHDDNIFRTKLAEESDLIVGLLPTIRLVNENAKRTLSFEYGAESATYRDSDDDDYVSQHFDFEGVSNFGEENKLSFLAGYEIGNEERGTGSSEGAINVGLGVVDGPTEFDDLTAGLLYEYGGDNTRSDFEVGIDYSDLEFKDFVAVNAGRDRKTTAIFSTYDYKIATTTAIFLTVEYKDFDYSSVSATQGFELDNTQTTAQIGVKWDVTKLIKGRAGVGVTSKEVDATGDDVSTSSWDVGIEWTPSANDLVVIETSREPNESTNVGLFLDVTSWNVSWQHMMSRHWGFDLYTDNSNTEFEADTREDDLSVVGASINYYFTKSVELDLAFESQELESNQSRFDYDRNLVMLTLSLEL